MSGHGLSKLYDTVNRFAIWGDLETLSPFGSGHINDTYVSRWNQAGARVRYLHQRINDRVFRRPDQVMENILRVTVHIAERLKAEGIRDRSRRVLTVVPAKSGDPWVRDAEGGWWRTYLFLEGTRSYDEAPSMAHAGSLGAAVGRFQKQLADLGEPRLHDTIPGFHDMDLRYEAFDAALKAAPQRMSEAADEIAFLMANRDRGAILSRALRMGRIPERICHNDTKMNNILIDQNGLEALCVVDLDTVMPGTPLYDLGDLVRTVANLAKEDEKDLAEIQFDSEAFDSLLNGYLSEARFFLTKAETDFLAEAGRTITQIMALRFLTDFLQNDRYYRITRPGQNLDRCRTQIAFIRSMDLHRKEIEAIVQRTLASYPEIG